jgi:hypothetical protein
VWLFDTHNSGRVGDRACRQAQLVERQQRQALVVDAAYAACSVCSVRRKKPVHVLIQERSGSTASISARKVSPSGMAGWPRTTPRIAGSCAGVSLGSQFRSIGAWARSASVRTAARIDPIEIVGEDAEICRKACVFAVALDVIHDVAPIP